MSDEMVICGRCGKTLHLVDKYEIPRHECAADAAGSSGAAPAESRFAENQVDALIALLAKMLDVEPEQATVLDEVDGLLTAYRDQKQVITNCEREIERLRSFGAAPTQRALAQDIAEHVFPSAGAAPRDERARETALLALVDEMLAHIESGRLCSMGSINDTYDAQIGREHVERWRAARAAAGGLDHE